MHYWMPIATGNWENYMDSEWLKTLKTDYLLTERQRSLSAWIPGFSILKIQGDVQP